MHFHIGNNILHLQKDIKLYMSSNYLKYTIIILISSLLFLPFLSHANLFDWDEINFAECAREMIVSKDYIRTQIDFMPFWEKPPLFIWIQVISMKIFGIGEYAARFPNAFTGVLTLISLFYIGKKVFNEKFALWWTLLYAATWLPHFYFKSGIIDPIFNFFIFLAFFQFYQIKHGSKKILHSILTGFLLGLAVLTKGPVAILVAAFSFVIYIVLNRGFKGYKLIHIFLIVLFLTVPFLSWLGLASIKFGFEYAKWFINEFITYQIRLFRTEDSDHGGPFYFHFIVLLIGCFPASAFLFQFFRKKTTDIVPKSDFTKLMWILFWVVLIIFSIVQTKIIHYSSLCYFPLTYLAAIQIYGLSEGKTSFKIPTKIILLFIGTILSLLITFIPVIGINKQILYPYCEQFIVGNLQAKVDWSYYECLIGILYFIGIWTSFFIANKLFKKGILVLCLVQIVFMQIAIVHFTPKVEAITQRAAIDFYKKFAGQEVYIHPVLFKSFAYLFYGQKIKATNSDYYLLNLKDDKGNELPPEVNMQWLMTGKVDKPTYFISRNQNADIYRKMPTVEEDGESNGFVFFKRR